MSPGKQTDRFLRIALLVNSRISAVLGAAVLLAAGPIAEQVGLAAALGFTPAFGFVFAAGLAVLLFGTGVGWTAKSRSLDQRTAAAALLLNAAWVLGSIGFLLSPFVIPDGGKWIVLTLAYVAAVFTALHGYGMWRARMFSSRSV